MIRSLQQIILKESNAIRQIPLSEVYEKAVELIVIQVHQKGGKLITSGMGKAGQIASNIATTFSSTGTIACFLHPSEAQHGDLGLLRRNDIMLLVSNSGKTRELVELISLARSLVADIQFIVITGNKKSPIAVNADVCLFTGNPSEVCPLGLTPTTSITVMTVIGDILVVETMKKIKFTTVDYAKRHHGGYIGSFLKAQSKKNMPLQTIKNKNICGSGRTNTFFNY